VRRATTIGLAVFLAAAAGRAQAPGKPSPRWPLDLPPVLTSSFGEYRSSHLHAGIDLGTGGRSGAPCYAVGDGHVARLRMSPFGYGKALYVQLDGGPLVVYAHLSRFAPAPAARARAEQRRRGRYSFDLTLPAGEIRVRRGEVVAWSGQTGVGVPHLHFEVREGDVAVNAQLHGFPVPDPQPPVIQEILVLPRDARSHVEGGLQARPLPRPARRAKGAAAPPPPAPLRVGGRIGFAVQAYDRAGSGEHRQGPYRYELRLDGRPLYTAAQVRFDYADNHLHVLECDQDRLVTSGERFFQLFLRPGNRLPGREAAPGGQGLLLASLDPQAVLHPAAEASAAVPGRHEVEIVVSDVAGHSTTRRFDIVVGGRPHLELVGQRDGAGLRLGGRAAGEDAPDLRLEVSRDLGATWESTAATTGPAGSVEAQVTWDGAQPLAARLRGRGAAGLEAVRTWTSGAGAESEVELRVAVRPQWGPAWLQVDIEPEALLAEPPQLVAELSDGERRELPVEQLETQRYRAALELERLVPGVHALVLQARALDGRRAARRGAWRARVVRRGQPARIADLDPRLGIEIPAGVLLEDVAVRLEPVRESGLRFGPELALAGPVFQVEPRGTAFDRSFRVRLQPEVEDAAPAGDGRGAEAPRRGLFHQGRGGSWTFLSAERDADGSLTGTTRFLSTFAVLVDSTPPRLGPLRVLRGGRLRFTVVDRGADLGTDAIVAELDGETAIPEWDPETGEVLIEPETRLARGSHRLRVTAVDQMGNRAERVHDFEIP
jgi:murein DD-endopeptidase MepM/ murein hydrolase activator NlpD